MKKAIIVSVILLCVIHLNGQISQFKSVPARNRIKYAEDFYKLYKMKMHYNTDNLLANIHWLQLALYAKFDHPIRAMALIRNKQEHLKYKRLFRMRINFLIMKSYLMLGRRYDKKNLYYFNKKYKKELLSGFQIARVYYKRASHYWERAVKWANSAWKLKHYHLKGSEVDKMQNQMFKIVKKNKWINHAPVIQRLLEKLEQKEKILTKDDND